jgi:hypothetical protein
MCLDVKGDLGGKNSFETALVAVVMTDISVFVIRSHGHADCLRRISWKSDRSD